MGKFETINEGGMDVGRGAPVKRLPHSHEGG